MTSTVKKVGGSMMILIPKALARDAGITVGQEVDLSPRDNGILVRPPVHRRRRPLSEITGAIDPAAYKQHRELANERPVGKESW